MEGWGERKRARVRGRVNGREAEEFGLAERGKSSSGKISIETPSVLL